MSAMCIDRPRGEVPEWNDAELDANASRSGDEGQYRRNGTANLFVFIDPHRPWRKVKVTDQRPAKDFAACMRDLVDIHYPEAKRIRVVLDNLSTHSPGALYETFPAADAHRILDRIEFHHTPKHASWLNMVEIEIGVLRHQCLDGRIADRTTLERQLAAWEKAAQQRGGPYYLDVHHRARPSQTGQGLPRDSQRVIITSRATRAVCVHSNS